MDDLDTGHVGGKSGVEILLDIGRFTKTGGDHGTQIIGVGDVPEVVVGADYFKNMGQNITVSPVVNIYGNVDDYDALARKVSDRINVDMQRKMRIY